MRTQGSARRRRASSSLCRVNSFSASSSLRRAASHSSRVPITCFVIVLSFAWLCVWLLIACPKSRFAGVGYLDPFRVGRGFGGVIVVPVPPFVGRGLRRAFGRILPSLLAAERGEIEVTPRGPHRLVAAIVDEV